MNRKLTFVLIAGLIGALGLFGLGCEMCCNSSQGSGSIVITDPVTSASHRANFTYRVECIGSYSEAEDPDRKVSGRLQYQDHGTWNNLKVSIQASMDNVVNTRDAYAQLELDRANGDTYYDFLSIPVPESAEAGYFCSTSYPNIGLFRGRYKPRPASLGEGGFVTVMVVDKGKSGPSPEDLFEIMLTGGVFDGYRQRGVLAHGDLKAL